jgi:hypothetical protein
MRDSRNGRPGTTRAARLGILGVALAVALPVPGVRAQYGYERPYGAPPVYEDDRGYRPPPRRAAREASGLNCAAVQASITGPKPYSCPLPGPRPLGARCFCDLPIASFSPAQTAVGQVVP